MKSLSVMPIAAAAIAASTLASANAGESADLRNYLARGLKSNPGLRAAWEGYQAATEKIPQAKSLPDPRLGFTEFIDKVQTRTGPQESQLMLSQTIPWMGKLRLRGSIASREARAIYHQYESKRLGLIRAISTAYYEYAWLAEAIRITRETLSLLEKLEPIVSEKVRGGGELGSLLRLQVEIEKNRDVLQSFEKERGRQSAAFSALLNRRDSSLLPWPKLAKPTRESFDRSKLINELLERNPNLRAVQERIEKASEAVRLAKLSPVPDPTFGANYIDIGDAGPNAYGVSVSFSIPLWFRKYKAEKREADAGYAAVVARLTDEENRLLAELESALRSLAEASDRIRLYDEKLLPTARQAVEVSETAYKADKSSILDFIDSERTLLSLEKIYWRAAADQEIQRVRLETLVGRGMAGGPGALEATPSVSR